MSLLGGLAAAVTNPALAIGAASLLGNVWSTHETNKTNKSIANSNNATMINLANTAHQREVKDLIASGLNPILSAGGTGAETPALQQAKMEAPQFDSYAVTDAIKALSEKELNTAQTKKLNQETLTEQAHTLTENARAKVAEIEYSIANNTKKEVIQQKKEELRKTLWQINEIQQKAAGIQINSVSELKRQQYIDEELQNRIANLYEDTKYTRERARGYSESGSAAANLGALGFNSGGSSSYYRSW